MNKELLREKYKLIRKNEKRQAKSSGKISMHRLAKQDI